RNLVWTQCPVAGSGRLPVADHAPADQDVSTSAAVANGLYGHRHQCDAGTLGQEPDRLPASGYDFPVPGHLVGPDLAHTVPGHEPFGPLLRTLHFGLLLASKNPRSLSSHPPPHGGRSCCAS